MAGLQAANAAEGGTLTDGTVGFVPHAQPGGDHQPGTNRSVMSDLPPPWASVADIGQLGLDTAAAVVERLLTLTRLTITRQPGGLTVPLLPATGDGVDARRVRAEAERLIDLYAEWTRSLVQAAVDAADPDRPAGEKLSLGPAPPDSFDPSNHLAPRPGRSSRRDDAPPGNRSGRPSRRRHLRGGHSVRTAGPGRDQSSDQPGGHGPRRRAARRRRRSLPRSYSRRRGSRGVPRGDS